MHRSAIIRRKMTVFEQKQWSFCFVHTSIRPYKSIFRSERGQYRKTMTLLSAGSHRFGGAGCSWRLFCRRYVRTSRSIRDGDEKHRASVRNAAGQPTNQHNQTTQLGPQQNKTKKGKRRNATRAKSVASQARAKQRERPLYSLPCTNSVLLPAVSSSILSFSLFLSLSLCDCRTMMDVTACDVATRTRQRTMHQRALSLLPVALSYAVFTVLLSFSPATAEPMSGPFVLLKEYKTTSSEVLQEVSTVQYSLNSMRKGDRRAMER